MKPTEALRHPVTSDRRIWLVTFEEMLAMIRITDGTEPVWDSRLEGWGTKYYQPQHAFSDLELALHYAMGMYQQYVEQVGAPPMEYPEFASLLYDDSYVVIDGKDSHGLDFRALIRLEVVGLDAKVERKRNGS